MQLGLAMLAASESGMGFGQGLMMAQQAAQQSFQSPIEGDLRANMTADALRRAQEQKDQELKFAEFTKQLDPNQAAQLTALPKEVAYQVMAELMTQKTETATPSDDMKEYQYAVSQGFTGSLRDWIIEQKRAGATTSSTTVNLPADNEFLKGVGRGASEQLGTLQTSADAASRQLSSIARLKPLVDDPGFISGTLGDARLTVAKALGLPGVEATQTYFAGVGDQVAERIKAFGAGTGLSDADREFAKQIAAGSIELTPASIKRIIRINEQSANAVIGLYNERRSFYSQKHPEVLDYYPQISTGWSIKKK
jgi:hypothetical protein